MKVLQICPPHLSDVATFPWEIQKKSFQQFFNTYFWLFMLSQKKTKCNPFAHPTWKCHHIDLWNAKPFHLTEGLLHSFKCWRRLWRQLWVVISGSEKNRLWCVATGMSGKQRHSKCLEWPPSALSLPVFFDSDQSHSTPCCAEIQPMSQQAAATSHNMSTSIHALLL